MSRFRHWGVDFAFGNGLTVGTLKSNHVEFVCRYLSGGGNGKDISALELRHYHDHGIHVVFNWETSGVERGFAQGAADARAAQAELDSLSHQSGVNVRKAPVIFSPDDFDPHLGTKGTVEFMRGANSVLGKVRRGLVRRRRAGLYGGYLAIEAAFRANVIHYAWQTLAWSGGQWHPKAQLQQYAVQVRMGPTQVDRDRATSDDYGQALLAVPKQPPSTPGLSRFVAHGDVSLDQAAIAHKTTVKDILAISAHELSDVHARNLLAYLAQGSDAKMPKGLVYWTKA